MKTLFSILAFFTFFIGFSHNGELNGRVVDIDNFGYPGVMIELQKDGVSLDQTQTDFEGNFVFTSIPLGTYSLKVNYVGMREATYDMIVVGLEKNTFNLTYPKPCVKSEKVCPKGHRSNIIPIVYGFPSDRMMQKAAQKKVKLGGCTPYCEKWHCTLHNLDF